MAWILFRLQGSWVPGLPGRHFAGLLSDSLVRDLPGPLLVVSLSEYRYCRQKAERGISIESLFFESYV